MKTVFDGFFFVECVDEKSAKFQVQVFSKETQKLVGIAYGYNGQWRVCNNPNFEDFHLDNAVKEVVSNYVKYHNDLKEFENKLKG